MSSQDIQPIQQLLNSWVLTAQALVGSIGALALVVAFLWRMTAVDAHSVHEARQWIQRIVIGTVGAEMAGTLVHVLTLSASGH